MNYEYFGGFEHMFVEYCEAAKSAQVLGDDEQGVERRPAAADVRARVLYDQQRGVRRQYALTAEQL